MEDTIAAISTPLGTGGIAIIRMSGPQALQLADAIFRSRAGRPSEFPSHTIHYGKIVQSGQVLDEVLLAVFRAPHSYTTENVVEIHCHGGVVTAQTILTLCLQHGARLAEPGEFTKRAFLYGRIDLAQAEAVMDLITARTERAQTLAARTLEGILSQRLETICEKLEPLRAEIEANLNFPEDDIPPVDQTKLCQTLDECISILQEILVSAHETRILKEGVSVVIVGRPNVGKSSLLNALVGKERALVTPFPGTTRDFIEETIALQGIPVRLIDTAGYRPPRGRIEAAGIQRTLQLVEQSDFVIHVFDASRPFSELDHKLQKICSKKSVIPVLNKDDLPRKIRSARYFAEITPISVSALTGSGMDTLRTALIKAIQSRFFGFGQTAQEVMVNERQANLLQGAQNHIKEARYHCDGSQKLDIVSDEIRRAIDLISQTTGKSASNFVIDLVFSRFCIGK